MAIGTVQNIEYNKRKVGIENLDAYAALFGGLTAQQALSTDSEEKGSRMNDEYRAIARKVYALHLQLFDAQGDEIAALKQATAALQRSHAIIGELLALTAKLAGYEKD